jgi:hypothetical protein
LYHLAKLNRSIQLLEQVHEKLDRTTTVNIANTGKKVPAYFVALILNLFFDFSQHGF